MSRLTPILLLGVWMLAAALPAAAQQQVPVSELDTDPEAYAGQEIVIRGEIVGDYGIRRTVVWFQVNDDPYVDAPRGETGELAGFNVGIGVRIPRERFDPDWGPPGDHRTRGPVVEVTGTFRYNDVAEAGETFIDATEIELVAPARALDRPQAARWPAITGGVLSALGLGALGYARFLRRP